MDVNANPLDPRSPCGPLPSLYLSSLLCLGTVSFSVCLLAEQAAYGYTETPQPALVQESAIDATTLDATTLDAATLATTLREGELNLDQNSSWQAWDQIQMNADEEPLSHLINDFDQVLDYNSSQIEATPDTTVEQSIDDALSLSDVEYSSESVDPEITDLEATDLGVTNLEATDLEVTDLEVIQPQGTDLEVTDLEVTDLEITQPQATDLEATQPEVTVATQFAAAETTELDISQSDAIDTQEAAELESVVEQSDSFATIPTATSVENTVAYTEASLLPTLEVTQLPEDAEAEPRETPISAPEDEFDRLQLRTQGVYLFEENESSARLRLTGSYVLSPNVLVGSTLDWTTGDAFFQTDETGFSVNELFVTVSPPTVPELRVTLGMIDLTSYFDRNSFAKDVATHFFNPVFQTNPALSAAGIGSRPGVLVNWALTDNVSIRGAAFSSDRDLGDFQFDAAAAEVDFRFGNAIIRGTYATNRDAGFNDGFREIYSFDRGDDEFGIESGDRETSYGLNAEVFIPELNIGLFGRYGWYNNDTLDVGGTTYSVGLNALDVFLADDRLGLAYGRQLSNDSLRDEQDEEFPDVMELFYDVRVLPFLRVGVSLQQRNGFSDTFAGFRIRGDLDLAELWR